METVILKTVSTGTVDYTSGIMKSRIENFYNIFDNYETRSHSPFMENGSSHYTFIRLLAFLPRKSPQFLICGDKR